MINKRNSSKQNPFLNNKFIKGVFDLKINNIVAGLFVGFFLTQIFLPFSGDFAFLQYPACGIRNGLTSLQYWNSLDTAVEELEISQGISSRILNLLKDRDELKNRFKILQEDRKIIVKALISKRRECSSQDECNPEDIDSHTVIDSLLLSTPLTLDMIDQSIERTKKEFKEIVRKRQQIEDNRESDEEAKKRIIAFYDMPKACVNLLKYPEILRVGSNLGLELTP
ncbi:hypothetical protein WH96_13355 [Kiloniella spongiae]|uniref:Uncharacterized protein n=2 Tax=Kiloniella spongiae TaxID=1489064 RepID=A0A0H2MC89_9PROT|nr:hypothetical protein WH96_13355 [Kiloniella spongiae]